MSADASGPQSMVVQLQGGERIHYLEWGPSLGSGSPPSTTSLPIVLVHELRRTAWTWLPVARLLAPRHRVVAPDLRGHGASDAPLSGYELEALALDMLTVVSGAGWGEEVGGSPVVVAGHGLGAMIAVEMARARPASVAALLLVDGGWEDMLGATRMLPDQLIEAMAEPPEALASMDAYLADREAFHLASWDADQEAAARAQVTEKHAGHVGLVTRGSVVRRIVNGMYDYRPLEALPEVGCPVTVLVADPGTADDEDARERGLAIEDVQRARASSGLAPMRVLRFPGAGHDLMRHRPADVAAQLARVSEGEAG